MTNNIDETAFPVASAEIPINSQGMSLRDWFAGQVIAGMYANPNYNDANYQDCATVAYRQANEMMEARKTLG